MRECLVSEPNYHITKNFLENFLAIEMIKLKAKINKIVYLSLSKLEINEALMYGCWYD